MRGGAPETTGAETSAPPRSARDAGGDPPRLIVCDWDGTVVRDRAEDAAHARRCIDALLRLDADVVLVTGTHIGNIDGQLALRPHGPGRLLACTNRGSEGFAIGRRGPRLLWRRDATPEEDAALDATAGEVLAWLAARGLDAQVVSSRLNRRKIDLIPSWADPPKSELARLLDAVTDRLRRVGVVGLSAVVAVARDAARRAGLTDPRITSDAKHVEIGLTDKSHALAWIRDEVFSPLDHRAVLVAGDEFGPLGGVPGSDAAMLAACPTPATVVSVGPEQGGAPAGVLHVGGGPPALLAHLESLAGELAHGPTPTPDASWRIVARGVHPLREREVESLLAVANGRLGVRASAPRRSPASDPATYVAGLWGRDPERPEGVVLVPGPDWCSLGPVGAHRNGRLRRVDRILDLRQGVLVTRAALASAEAIGTWQFASFRDRSLLAWRMEWDGAPDASPHPGNVALPRDCPAARYSLTPLESGVRCTVRACGGGAVVLDCATVASPGSAERLVTVRRLDGQGAAPASALSRPARSGFGRAFAAHRAALRHRWEGADVEIDGDPTAQRAIRYAVWSLMSAVDPDAESSPVGPRGLTGPGYGGHVFWDTEAFVLPFHVLTHPPSARAILGYRSATIGGARASARALGWRGARFAWESTGDGADVTPTTGLTPGGEVVPILTGQQEIHVSAVVAWGVWRYFTVTGDWRHMLRTGAEILVETARFWESRCESRADGHLHIAGVIGPDEYHEDVTDNAFTNVMAAWNLRRAAEMVRTVAERRPAAWRTLRERLRLSAGEPSRWERAATALVDGFDPERGVFEQFAGYFDLRDLRASEVAVRPFVADAVMPPEDVDASRLIKQADVVMLCHMLGDEIPPEVIERCYRVYEPATTHGSSLSPGIHACVAARVGELDEALDHFRLACAIDIDDRMGNLAHGVHLAALGSVWQAVVLGFGGVQPWGSLLRVDPRLPAEWRAITCRFRWRGARLVVGVRHDEVAVHTDRAVSIAVGAGPPRRLRPGAHRFDLDPRRESR